MPTRGDHTPQPVRSLRDWLDRLAVRERPLVLNPAIGLRHELAAVAKRLDGVEKVGVAALLAGTGRANWREAVKR